MFYSLFQEYAIGNSYAEYKVFSGGVNERKYN